jgi:hypothetical protein
MHSQRDELLTGLRVPDFHYLVGAGRGDLPAVGLKASVRVGYSSENKRCNDRPVEESQIRNVASLAAENSFRPSGL